MQLAKKAGARVIGTASSPAQLEVLRRYGLDEGIDYRNENVQDRVLALTDGRGVDLAIDPVGGPSMQQVIASVRNGGRIILVGMSSREQTLIDPIGFVPGNKTLAGFDLSAQIHLPRVHAYIADMIRRLAGGELEVVIDRAFPLADAAAAHSYAEQRGRIGRVVMVP